MSNELKYESEYVSKNEPPRLPDDLIRMIDLPEMQSIFHDIYLDADKASRQPKRYKDAVSAFRDTFGNREAAIFSAPGRTEVGGNHTDHQHGEVLAASINDDAIAVAAIRDDRTVRVLSAGYPLIELSLTEELSPLPEEEGTTAGLIRGMIAGLMERGYHVGGFDAYITSDVLGGSGLSSSAAFETLIGTIISVNETKNSRSGEEIYLLDIECIYYVIRIAINKKDLMGEPSPGRRFRGITLLQGAVRAE